MISPFFPWFLAFLLLIACVALLVLLLRYRDRSVRLEAESRSWQERAEDRTQMLRRAEEVLKDSFAGISAEVLRNSEKQFLNLAETRLQSQRQQANHDLDSRKQAIESMLKPTKMKRQLFVTITVTTVAVSLFLGILLFWQIQYLEVRVGAKGSRVAD